MAWSATINLVTSFLLPAPIGFVVGIIADLIGEHILS